MPNEPGPARKQAGQAIYLAEKSRRDQGENRALQGPDPAAQSAQAASGTASHAMRT